MKSKSERLNDSFENIEEAIKYYTKDVRSKFYTNKMTKAEYEKTIKAFSKISELLSYFKSKKSFDRKKLDEIRAIHLSVFDYYEEGDYDFIVGELFKVNNELNREYREEDKKLLGSFKKTFNGLSPFYQFRLAKAEKQPGNELAYRNKNFDNISFIVENYLNIKYNFGKLKSKPAPISDEHLKLVEECDRFIQSKEMDKKTRDFYSHLKEIILKFARADVIVQQLEKMKTLCSSDEYQFVISRISQLIEKYKKISLEYKEKYDLERNNISSKSDFDLEQILDDFITSMEQADSIPDDIHFNK